MDRRKFGPTKIPVTSINQQLTCALCGGYYIDATTITECLHSFCKSCIVTYLQTSKYCPTCEVQVHKTRPLQHIRPDRTLQDLVYKLVPGLFAKESLKRKAFDKQREKQEREKKERKERKEKKEKQQKSLQTKVKQEEENEDTIMEDDIKEEPEPEVEEEEEEEEEIELPKPESENISISLDFSPDGKPHNRKKENGKYPTKRFLLCPGEFSVRLLKKFIRMKFGLPQHYEVDVFHTAEMLNEKYTMADIGYIYSWQRRSPLKLFYSVFLDPNRTGSPKIATELPEDMRAALQFSPTSRLDTSRLAGLPSPSSVRKLVIPSSTTTAAKPKKSSPSKNSAVAKSSGAAKSPAALVAASQNTPASTISSCTGTAPAATGINYQNLPKVTLRTGLGQPKVTGASAPFTMASLPPGTVAVSSSGQVITSQPMNQAFNQQTVLITPKVDRVSVGTPMQTQTPGPMMTQAIAVKPTQGQGVVQGQGTPGQQGDGQAKPRKPRKKKPKDPNAPQKPRSQVLVRDGAGRFLSPKNMDDAASITTITVSPDKITKVHTPTAKAGSSQGPSGKGEGSVTVVTTRDHPPPQPKGPAPPKLAKQPGQTVLKTNMKPAVVSKPTNNSRIVYNLAKTTNGQSCYITKTGPMSSANTAVIANVTPYFNSQNARLIVPKSAQMHMQQGASGMNTQPMMLITPDTAGLKTVTNAVVVSRPVHAFSSTPALTTQATIARSNPQFTIPMSTPSSSMLMPSSTMLNTPVSAMPMMFTVSSAAMSPATVVYSTSTTSTSVTPMTTSTTTMSVPTPAPVVATPTTQLQSAPLPVQPNSQPALNAPTATPKDGSESDSSSSGSSGSSSSGSSSDESSSIESPEPKTKAGLSPPLKPTETVNTDASTTKVTAPSTPPPPAAKPPSPTTPVTPGGTKALSSKPGTYSRNGKAGATLAAKIEQIHSSLMPNATKVAKTAVVSSTTTGTVSSMSSSGGRSLLISPVPSSTMTTDKDQTASKGNNSASKGNNSASNGNNSAKSDGVNKNEAKTTISVSHAMDKSTPAASTSPAFDSMATMFPPNTQAKHHSLPIMSQKPIPPGMTVLGTISVLNPGGAQLKPKPKPKPSAKATASGKRAASVSLVSPNKLQKSESGAKIPVLPSPVASVASTTSGASSTTTVSTTQATSETKPVAMDTTSKPSAKVVAASTNGDTKATEKTSNGNGPTSSNGSTDPKMAAKQIPGSSNREKASEKVSTKPASPKPASKPASPKPASKPASPKPATSQKTVIKASPTTKKPSGKVAPKRPLAKQNSKEAPMDTADVAKILPPKSPEKDGFKVQPGEDPVVIYIVNDEETKDSKDTPKTSDTANRKRKATNGESSVTTTTTTTSNNNKVESLSPTGNKENGEQHNKRKKEEEKKGLVEENNGQKEEQIVVDDSDSEELAAVKASVQKELAAIESKTTKTTIATS